ncbi:MAG: hypothetical protein HYX40_05800 [Sphingobacteriales bacterium]|nr:hypothetical protein [Sphingobacteriales bacterium]
MKKTINKLSASEAAMPVAHSSPTGIQPLTTNHHTKAVCKNVTATGYCSRCRRLCPAAVFNVTFNQ